MKKRRKKRKGFKRDDSKLDDAGSNKSAAGARNNK